MVFPERILPEITIAHCFDSHPRIDVTQKPRLSCGFFDNAIVPPHNGQSIFEELYSPISNASDAGRLA